MSHFSVLVIGDDVERQLAPYHEFECTGRDDEFVQNIDRMEEAREEYAERGDDEPFAEFVEGWYGLSRVQPGEEPDLANAHKYGWLRVDEAGEVVEVIDRTNPNKRWDWWTVGGRWTGFLTLKPGCTGDLGDIGVSEMFYSHEERVALAVERTYRADCAKKGDIDFAAMRAEAEREAAGRYDRAHTLIGDHPIRTWEEVRTAHPGDISDARKEYWEQPATVALREDRDLAWEGPDQFAVSRDTYLARARNAAGRTFAVVKDGEWFERGKMGWFASVAGDVGDDEWDRQFAALVDGLADDTLLTVVDCHI